MVNAKFLSYYSNTYLNFFFFFKKYQQISKNVKEEAQGNAADR